MKTAYILTDVDISYRTNAKDITIEEIRGSEVYGDIKSNIQDSTLTTLLNGNNPQIMGLIVEVSTGESSYALLDEFSVALNYYDEIKLVSIRTQPYKILMAVSKG